MTGGPARIRADARTRSGRRKGQAMVETVVVMFVLCLVFFLVYEYANLLTAHTVVNYAAARAARARTVGFNDFMVTKTIRVATASVPVDSDKLGWSADEPGGENAELTIHVWQRRNLYGSGEDCDHRDLHEVRGEAGIESHYPLYLQ